MAPNTTPQNGFWMMVEEPIESNANAENQPENDPENFRDTYDFYPDAGF